MKTSYCLYICNQVRAVVAVLAATRIVREILFNQTVLLYNYFLFCFNNGGCYCLIRFCLFANRYAVFAYYLRYIYRIVIGVLRLLYDFIIYIQRNFFAPYIQH